MIQSKPSEKGEIITYLSRMGDVLKELLENVKIAGGKYSRVVGILYNGIETKVFLNGEEKLMEQKVSNLKSTILIYLMTLK